MRLRPKIGPSNLLPLSCQRGLSKRDISSRYSTVCLEPLRDPHGLWDKSLLSLTYKTSHDPAPALLFLFTLHVPMMPDYLFFLKVSCFVRSLPFLSEISSLTLTPDSHTYILRLVSKGSYFLSLQ